MRILMVVLNKIDNIPLSGLKIIYSIVVKSIKIITKSRTHTWYFFETQSVSKGEITNVAPNIHL